MSKPLSNRLTIIYKTSISRTEWEAGGGGGGADRLGETVEVH